MYLLSVSAERTHRVCPLEKCHLYHCAGIELGLQILVTDKYMCVVDSIFTSDRHILKYNLDLC